MPNPAGPQSLNRYAYTLNNPLKYVDPSGHIEVNTGDAYQDPYSDYWYTYVNPALPECYASDQFIAQTAATAIDFTPGLGDAKGFIEVFTGHDLITGEDLGAWRYLGLFALAELRHADEFVGLARVLSDSAAEFGDEGVIILSKADFAKYGAEWGAHTGQVFVLTKLDADLMRYAPDIDEVGHRIGKKFPEGSELLRIDISDLSSHNVRIPTDHFDERFIPGGWTDAGLAERVIDGPINLNNYPKCKLIYGR